MKKILLLVSCFAVFAIQLFSQTKNGKDLFHSRNANNKPETDLFRHPSVVNTINTNSIVYDTVRAIDELNDSQAADAYPWLSPDALHLYYLNSTSGNQIMFSERILSTAPFSTPVPFSMPVSVVSIWLSNDELDFYASDGGNLYYGHRSSSAIPFSTFSTITLNGITTSFLSGPSLDQSQNELFLYVVGAQTEIAQFTRTGPGAFDLVSIIPMPVNYEASPGQLSKDGLSYYMPLKYLGAASRLYEYKRTSLSDPFTLTSFNPVEGITDTVTYKTQPTVSDDGAYLVFVSSQTNSWLENGV